MAKPMNDCPFSSSSFSFGLSIAGEPESQMAFFQEVSGLEAVLYSDKDQKSKGIDFAFLLQGTDVSPSLVCQRGSLIKGSGLAIWFMGFLDQEASVDFSPRILELTLLDENNHVSMLWRIQNAFPVQCSFTTPPTDNEVLAIESLEFSYSSITLIPGKPSDGF